MTDIKNTLRHFIVANYLPGESMENLKDETPLRTSGVLDSMSTLALVSFIEERFGISLEAHETGIEYFDRIEDIAKLVEQKRRTGV
jgi:acyl carrier protein